MTSFISRFGQSPTSMLRAEMRRAGGILQPRRVKVPDRIHGALAARERRKAEPGNEAHVGAPMPGVVSALAVVAGHKVAAGDVLLSIDAMKMETALHAERDGAIAEVLVRAGDQIDAKDLLVVFG
jgi:pyruvate carboxylase